jgi:hypothetical protein
MRHNTIPYDDNVFLYCSLVDPFENLSVCYFLSMASKDAIAVGFYRIVHAFLCLKFSFKVVHE